MVCASAIANDSSGTFVRLSHAQLGNDRFSARGSTFNKGIQQVSGQAVFHTSRRGGNEELVVNVKNSKMVVSFAFRVQSSQSWPHGFQHITYIMLDFGILSQLQLPKVPSHAKELFITLKSCLAS
jgi:hypothetical protein